MVDQIRFFAGAARVLEGMSAGEYMAGHTSWIRREPIGVCAQVTPWNYPMMMAIWKIAPALAAGNTVVLKPSDTTPVSTLRLAELAAEVFPDGVLNVICGDRDTGAALDLPQDPADGVDHRLGARRHGGHAQRRRRPQERPPGAGRQGAGPGVRRCRRRGGGRGHRHRRLLQRRPGLHRRHPRDRLGPGIHDELAAALAAQAPGTTTGPPSNADADYGPLNNAEPARAGERHRRAGRRATPRSRRRRSRWGSRASSTPPRWSAACSRTTSSSRARSSGRSSPSSASPTRTRPCASPTGSSTACLERVHHGPRPGAAGVAPARLRVRLDQHPHPAGGRDAPRRLQALGHRQGPSHVRLRGLHPDQARDVGVLMGLRRRGASR